ncbi:MAG: hypothetical protein K6A30_08230 [Lachnospiraceae bacterium]|nr:hypothetical protein [Lachnospiraceae bacterium]
MGEKDGFMQALHRFTTDVASAGAIRHLADLGYTVDQIKEELTYPTSIGCIQQVVWEHYLEMGIVSMSPPKKGDIRQVVSYEKVQNSTGKQSFVKVVKEETCPQREYVCCEFGKEMYKDKEKFLKKISVLNSRDQEYLLGLPWPLTPTYHVKDERMSRIIDDLNSNEK